MSMHLSKFSAAFALLSRQKFDDKIMHKEFKLQNVNLALKMNCHEFNCSYAALQSI